jgi:hypothetical protein
MSTFNPENLPSIEEIKEKIKKWSVNLFELQQFMYWFACHINRVEKEWKEALEQHEYDYHTE